MKKNLFSVIFIILFSLVLNANVDLGGFIRNYTGVLFENNHKFAILQNSFDLNFSKTTDRAAFKINPYFYQYNDNKNVIGFREAYMDIYLNSIDLRIGKQQIIWGKADGVFITDIVCPKDLRNFLLPEFNEIRIGQTSLKADYYIGNNSFELVWIPKSTSDILPDNNSIWHSQMRFPVVPQWDFSQKNINFNLHNSEFFTKFSAMTSLVDFEIMSGYMWDDEPTMHIKATVDTTTNTINSILITPEYHRLTVFGGSFGSILGKFVIRGEGAYYIGKYFSTNNLLKNDAISKKDYINYLLGLDTSFYDFKLSGQFIQTYILNYENIINDDEFENMMTFLISKTFLNETLRFEFFTYFDLNEKDSLIRLKAIYNLADGSDVTLGSNIFTGTKGKFGQFDKNDMMIFKLKYSF